MPNKTFIKAATSLAIFNAIDNIKEIAVRHERTNDVEYVDNMFIVSLVGHIIASEQDKKELMDFLLLLVDKRDKMEQEVLIDKAKGLL